MCFALVLNSQAWWLIILLRPCETVEPVKKSNSIFIFLRNIFLLGELSSDKFLMERFLPLCTNIQVPGGRITAYTRNTQPIDIHAVSSRESKTNKWHNFWTGCESTSIPATDPTVETGSSRKRWPAWLLLLLLRQSLSECPPASSYLTLVQKVYCIWVDVWNKYSVTLRGELQSVVAHRQRKASFSILFMVSIWSCILWSSVLGTATEPAGRWYWVTRWFCLPGISHAT